MAENLPIWDLTDYYEDINDPQIEKDINELKELSESFKNKVKGKLQDEFSIDQLQQWFKEYEKIGEKAFYLDTYSQLLYRIMSLEDAIKIFQSKIEEFTVNIQENLIFFLLELNEISDEKYEEIVQAPELKPYKHTIEFNRLEKVHQLTEKEEQIILMKDITGVNGFRKLYREIKSSFTYDFEIDGEMKRMTAADLYSLLYHEDKEIRYNALKTYLQKYKENGMVFTHVLNNVLKDWALETKKKGFETPISRKNLHNEVSDKSVDILGRVTTDSYHIVERYYNLKKKILGLSELHISDLYAPVGKVNKKYTFTEAVDLIKSIDKVFYPDFEEIIKKMIIKNHIDAKPRKGKVRGAFCAHGKMKHYPFVYINFANDLDSILSLAHELGHAFHAYYMQQEQSFINGHDISLVVAEIASVFNEILVYDHLVNSDISNDEKISLLCFFIESNFSTSHRQNAFYQFEKKIHNILKEKLLTTEEIKETFGNEMERMFGNSMVNVKEDYSDFCFVVSHFLEVPFYVYAYNMSNLLVISLYKLYLEQKDDFIPKYVKLLSLGSSLTPQEMLKELDIDLNDSSFWHKGLDFLAEKIEELSKLVGKKMN